MVTIENYSLDKRKNEGIFYTPPFLAEYLSRKVIKYWGVNREISSVIDPACGDSELLRSFITEINNYSQISLPKIIGVDKDNNAIFNSKTKLNHLNLKVKSYFINTDALFPFEFIKPEIGWKKLREDTNCKHGFNISLSNPPWGSDIKSYNLKDLNSSFKLSKGQFDVFDLFFETILTNLSKNGIYGLILPDSVFSQEQTKFRELISKKTSIHLIARLGEKIFPDINRACVVIIGENKIPKNNHYVDCFRLTADFKKMVISNKLSLEEVEKELSHKVLQTRFLENKNYLFDIDLKIEEQDLIGKLKSYSTELNNFLESKRGAELSKKGIVCQCNNCEYWMPFPRSKNPKCNNCRSTINLDETKSEKIISSIPSSNSIKLKVGEDLYRYTSKSKSFIDLSKKGINYKNLDIYQKTKILVRKTGIGITASIDYENSMTNQVVYILNLKKEFKDNLTLEFVLSILNSRVVTYYLIKKYGENEWRTHPYLTQNALMNLPFPLLKLKEERTQKAIIKITKLINEEVHNSNEINISKNTDLLIERIVADLFNLNQSDYHIIFETLKNCEQLIPIKRLLNCNVTEIFNLNGL
ncbi:TaqI-like C-terminal specificity domain-containing protein [Flavobacterium chungbukense]|uniref:site-specific DNA-methyltransferase (adenine-specific) n=1 Tax=Flavobacterium chungbukense TaxID=877464 RepID=A0ABP7YV53_9FLAO|nr:TaqI-like C-terminal specificity domain-containing protein [Flavobacterium chungbukense]MCC4923212.1 N-6 DNA methylase [Flavobacterium chungbukense]